MIIEPITIGQFRLVDVQELSERQQFNVATSLRDGLNIFPEEFKCEAVARDPDGAYPIIRFGVFVKDTLVGSIWLGCNTTAPRHTERNARINTRPLVGPIFRRESVFFRTDIFISMIKFFLNNVLPTREGGTVEIVSFETVDNIKAVTDGLSGFYADFLAGLDVSVDCTVDRADLSDGVFNFQVRKRIVDRPMPIRGRR